MLLVEVSSETGFFIHLSNHIFRSPSVQKYISYEGHIFFENVQNWIYISKLQKKKKKKQKKFLLSEIIASQYVAINCLY